MSWDGGSVFGFDRWSWHATPPPCTRSIPPAFATTADYMPESLAEFIERNLEVYDFDAGFSRVATEHAPEPWLGTTMLRSAFAAFAAAGLREAQLGVAAYNDRGLRVYERVGMTVRHHFDIYERLLDEAPSG